MDITELMIGDWVNTPKGKFRVSSIQDNDVIFIDEIQGADGGFFIEQIKPIKITAEVLEMNGFEKQGFPGWQIYEDGKYGILWRNDYPDVLRIESYCAEYGTFNRFNISYIHELQHALRLCGIDKEIVL